MPFFNDLFLASNMPQFLISLLHWSQISLEYFFWGLQTASSCWGSDLENRVGVEAIQNAIHVVLPPLQSTCDMVYCLGKRALITGSFLDDFWQFIASNASIMLLNICYWWFFLSQGNWWTKYLAHPKTLSADVCVFDHFERLSPAAADLTLELSSRSMFHPLSHIYAKTVFCCIETVVNNALNRQHVVVLSTVSNHTTHFEHSFYLEFR